MQLAASLAASPALAPLLADGRALSPAAAAAAAAGEGGEGLRPCLEPWAAEERLGSRRVGSVAGSGRTVALRLTSLRAQGRSVLVACGGTAARPW